MTSQGSKRSKKTNPMAGRAAAVLLCVLGLSGFVDRANGQTWLSSVIQLHGSGTTNVSFELTPPTGREPWN